MATTYTYADAYLSKYCTEERETRAIAAVTLQAGTRDLSADWIESLVITQTYIIACVENQGAAEDLFAVKLKNYQTIHDGDLMQAIIAADEAAEEVSDSPFSIPLERG